MKSCSSPADFRSITEERSRSPTGCRASPSATYMQCLDPSGERTLATIRFVFYLFVDKICFFLKKTKKKNPKKLSCVILSYHLDSFPRQESRLVVAYFLELSWLGADSEVAVFFGALQKWSWFINWPLCLVIRGNFGSIKGAVLANFCV